MPSSRGFYDKEAHHKSEWAWSRGERCTLEGVDNGWFYFRLRIPKAGTTLRILLNGAAWKTIQSKIDWEECAGRIPVANAWRIQFVVDCWNGHGAVVSEEDSRDLALNFITARIVPAQSAAEGPRLEGKICPVAFSRLESNYPFAPCNRWFLQEDLHFSSPEKDAWNGIAAQELRNSMYDGSFRYCRRDICQTPLVDISQLEQAAPEIDPRNLEAIRARVPVLPAGPTRMAIQADPRCNLACASCRPKAITKLTPDDHEEIRRLDSFLETNGQFLKRITFAVNGDVFFSPFLRERLKLATPSLFPALEEIEILSNGLLFDQKMLDQLRPGSDFIKLVKITVDAGDAETYSAVRGGDWARLMQNLAWMAGLRRAGRFSSFRLNFVVQRLNYRSLPRFFSLAKGLGVDSVLLSKLQDWSDMKLDFVAEGVSHPSHPEHFALKEICEPLFAQRWPFKIESNLFGEGEMKPLDGGGVHITPFTWG